MLIVIDIGNTNIVLGAYEGDVLVDHWRLQTHTGHTIDEMGILLRQLFAARAVDLDAIDSAIISCVMPTMLGTTVGMLERYFDVTPLVVGPGIRTHMPILCDNPKEVGADRIVNSVAGYELYKEGLIVVDFGTATTFDAVSPKGEYLGGAIAPGINISAEALFQKASKLPRIELTRPDKVVGKNTVASMQSGIFFGYVGLVRAIVSRMKDELGFPVRTIATGGLAGLFAQETNCIEEIHKHLTLEGLRILYHRNR